MDTVKDAHGDLERRDQMTKGGPCTPNTWSCWQQAGVHMRDEVEDGNDRRQDRSMTKSSRSVEELGGLATPRTWSTHVVTVEVA
jgi:hypothetical protein